MKTIDNRISQIFNYQLHRSLINIFPDDSVVYEDVSKNIWGPVGQTFVNTHNNVENNVRKDIHNND